MQPAIIFQQTALSCMRQGDDSDMRTEDGDDEPENDAEPGQPPVDAADRGLHDDEEDQRRLRSTAAGPSRPEHPAPVCDSGATGHVTRSRPEDQSRTIQNVVGPKAKAPMKPSRSPKNGMLICRLPAASTLRTFSFRPSLPNFHNQRFGSTDDDLPYEICRTHLSVHMYDREDS